MTPQHHNPLHPGALIFDRTKRRLRESLVTRLPIVLVLFEVLLVVY